MLVGVRGLLVLGIDHERENSELRAQRPDPSIPQEAAAETMPAIGLVDGEAADARDGNEGVARELLRQRLRHLGQGNAAGGQGIVTRDLGVVPIERNIAGSRPAAYVLGNLLAEITVECLDTA
jgi:hypothetical protein